MSHPETVRLNDLKVQARLLGFLDHNSEWLAARVYEVGLAWLNSHYGFDPRLEKALEASEAFWQWWKNDWRHRDTYLNAGLKVLNVGVLTHSAPAGNDQDPGHTFFFHTPDEFEGFYLALHAAFPPDMRLPKPVLAAVQRGLRKESRIDLSFLRKLLY